MEEQQTLKNGENNKQSASKIKLLSLYDFIGKIKIKIKKRMEDSFSFNNYNRLDYAYVYNGK